MELKAITESSPPKRPPGIRGLVLRSRFSNATLAVYWRSETHSSHPSSPSPHITPDTQLKRLMYYLLPVRYYNN
ncbi:hypothetical protein E2C01_032556 [Portunus trituberculatus]|uniref:Uncharacterized protein n=1 Tax=Portunus trituberculatus TaxID=210409 RepID=A0A5B7F0K8_PORTR|nr:hypothetical protein [Portunus trituberculatus]